MKRPKILVVGSAVMDLIVSAGRLPASGETVIGHGFRTAAGGKGANQAVQAARLGAEVTMVGKVGADAFGQELIASLRSAGVDTGHIGIATDVPSAVGNVQLERTAAGTANRIVVVPGANHAIVPEDVAFLQEDIAAYDMVILQLEIPMAVNELVIGYACDKGVPVMLNAAPYAAIAPQVLKRLAYISPNEHEAGEMVGFPVDEDDAVRRAVQTLLGQGIANVIITLGGRGAAFGNAQEFFLCPCVPGVTPKDPTAAGDSFVGAFCVGVCSGLSDRRAMELARYAAALTVSRMGAQPSLPTLPEVRELMHRCGENVGDLTWPL